MVNAAAPDPSPRIRCRRIEDADLPAVVDLLTRGFSPRRTRAFWHDVIERLRNRPTPAELPRYGYLLETGDRLVGAILQIFSIIRATDRAPSTRCNVSSWYVDPEFRGYAPLLVARAIKQKAVTYLNISSVPHTRPILQAQGYTRYSNGIFVTVPALTGGAGARVRICEAPAVPQAACDADERALLEEHVRYGCVSLWCETGDGVYPFVFRPRRVKRLVPCAQLVYCRSIDDFVRFARPLGLTLARHGRPLVILDANGPVPGLPGKYFDETMPRYFKGAAPPRLGDLAYTEAALFGM
jgi:hypothetical protein